MFQKILLALVLVLFVSMEARASIVFNPSVFYYTREEKQGSGTPTEFNQQIINLKLGYLTDSLYFGFAYDMESREHGGTAQDEDRDSLGGTIGYMSNGWNIFGTYYFKSEFEDYEGTGYELALGYSFSVGGVSFGPVFMYRHFEYDEENGASVAELEHNNLLPALQFMFVF